jgi:hypothetical protein
MVARAKQLLTPRSPKTPKTPDTPRAEKLHGAFCRTKSAVKSFRRGSKEVFVEQESRDSLRSGFYSKDEVFEFSMISNEPPQTAPLRPVSKLFPDLTIFVPENDIAREFQIEHNSVEDNDELFSDFSEISYHDSPVIASLRTRSSTVDSVSLDEGTTAETTFYTAGETSFYYTPSAKEEDDVFTISPASWRNCRTQWVLIAGTRPRRSYPLKRAHLLTLRRLRRSFDNPLEESSLVRCERSTIRQNQLLLS